MKDNNRGEQRNESHKDTQAKVHHNPDPEYLETGEKAKKMVGLMSNADQEMIKEAQQYPNSGTDNQSTRSVVYGDGKQTPIVPNRGDSVSETINVDRNTDSKDHGATRKNYTETFSQLSGSPQSQQGQRLVLPQRDEAHSPTPYEPNMKKVGQSGETQQLHQPKHDHSTQYQDEAPNMVQQKDPQAFINNPNSGDGKSNIGEKINEVYVKGKEEASELKEEVKNKAESMGAQARDKAKDLEAKAENMGAQVKHKAEDVGAQVKHKAEDLGAQARDKAKDMEAKAENLGAQAIDKAKDLGAQAKHKAEDLEARAKQTLTQTSKDIKDKTADVKDSLKDSAIKAKDYVTEKAKDAKDTIGHAVDDARKSQAYENTKETLIHAKDVAVDKISDAKDTVQSQLKHARDVSAEKMKSMNNDMSHTLADAKEYVTEKAKDAKEVITHKATDAKKALDDSKVLETIKDKAVELEKGVVKTYNDVTGSETFQNLEKQAKDVAHKVVDKVSDAADSLTKSSPSATNVTDTTIHKIEENVVNLAYTAKEKIEEVKESQPVHKLKDTLLATTFFLSNAYDAVKHKVAEMVFEDLDGTLTAKENARSDDLRQDYENVKEKATEVKNEVRDRASDIGESAKETIKRESEAPSGELKLGGRSKSTDSLGDYDQFKL